MGDRKIPSEKALELLGKVPDRIVAEQEGVSVSLVSTWRRRRGIPPQYGRGRKIPTEEKKARLESKYPGILEMLGRTADINVSKKYGFSRERARQIRTSLGIARFSKVCEVPPEVLGTKTDAELAEEYGLSAQTIGNLRREWGIPRYRNPEIQKKIESLKDRLGKVSDHQLGREVGLHPAYVHRARTKLGIPPAKPAPKYNPLDRKEIAHLFHQGLTDEQIAHAVGGKSPEIIGMIRTGELRLLRRPSNKTRIPDKIDWSQIDPLLGTMSDKKLADKFGIRSFYVSVRRRRLGIQAYGIRPRK